ncbi:uncharacterized protein JCM10292_006528 [Rhodotorula paludigena]|uniref:uncharacterized protein n=1 Tax=Rhodotorula paludigena TaxID=86838 RepID=UPI00316B40E3
MHSSLLFTITLAALRLVEARAGHDALLAHNIRSLVKRASSPAQSSYLSDIYNMVTPRCEKTCNVGLQDLTACSTLANQATIAACACSSVTLGDLRSCASCISTTATSTHNQTTVVSAYNSFVDLCTAEGLASVTGTVEVGASTRAISRTSTNAAQSAAATSAASSETVSSRATYNPSPSPVTTASVPALIASGEVASSARASASDAAVAAAQSGGNGAARLAGQAFAALSAVAVGAVLLA